MERERWSLEHDGQVHEVLVRRHRFTLSAEWFVDGALVGSGSEFGENSLVLSPDDPGLMYGAVGVKGPQGLSATRRVVLRPTTPVDGPDAPESMEPTSADADHEDDQEDEDDEALLAEASLFLSFDRGTVDLVPDPGTRAARRQDWILRHPRLHVVRETFSAGGAVLWGVIFVAVVVPVLERLLPRVPWPDINLPSIPWPDIDLPSIPWPDIDLPSIPWPDLPDLPDLPDWLGTALKLLFAVAIAGAVASSEVKRRRERAQHTADTPTPAPARQAPSSDGASANDESADGDRVQPGQ